MDKRLDRIVALLSIHPIYTERLLNGSKGVELRKTRLSKEIDYVVMYSTSPIKKIVGYFSVRKIVVASPSAIWSEYGNIAGIEKSSFIQYYRQSKQAVAIEVDEVYRLQYLVPLSFLGENLRPPQSFQYIDGDAIESLRSYAPLLSQSAA